MNQKRLLWFFIALGGIKRVLFAIKKNAIDLKLQQIAISIFGTSNHNIGFVQKHVLNP